MELQNRLGELMAEYHRRTGKRLTQKTLEKKTGIAQSTISAYVTNQVTRYDADTVLRFLEFFGVGISDFLIVVELEDDDQGNPAGSLAATG